MSAPVATSKWTCGRISVQVARASFGVQSSER